MYNLKGFINISDLINNETGVVSVLGEMSPIAMSYAKEKGYYSNIDAQGIELISMSGLLDESSVISKAPVPGEVAQLATLVGQWVRDNANNSGLMGEVNGTYPDYLNALNAYFTGPSFTDFEFLNLAMGDMVTLSVPSLTDKKMPEWISYSLVYDDGPTEKPATTKLWFSDLAFRAQFDEYEIEVVPPIDNLDDFFLPYTQVKDLIDAFTPPVMMQKIAEAIDIYPPTLVKTNMYTWEDNELPPNTIETPWTVVIYGMAGNNVDLIIAAIREYILNNSTHPYEDWLDIFPDIFRTTEFVITPMWNRYAIPNMTLTAGVYSPMVNFNQDIDDYLLTVLNYDEAHVRLHTMSGVLTYKSLSFYVVGSPDNRNNQFDFDDVFPDYIAVDTNSLDFGKMSAKTQGWVLFINEMIQIAESMTESSSIPFTCTRVTRNGVLYLASSYDDIQYLITSKKYFEEEVPPPEEI